MWTTDEIDQQANDTQWNEEREAILAERAELEAWLDGPEFARLAVRQLIGRAA